MNWYLQVLKNYATFSGRARRTEFWMFVLFNFIIAIVLMFIDRISGLNFIRFGLFYTYNDLSTLYSLSVLIPSLAVSVRRLHDTGRSGWMIFVGLIPLIGPIWLLVLMVTEGDKQENEYGSNPKEVVPEY